MKNNLVAIFIILAWVAVLAFSIPGCVVDALTDSFGEETRKTTDPLPPGRPPLPCGYYAVDDSTWGYDIHADTCQ